MKRTIFVVMIALCFVGIIQLFFFHNIAVAQQTEPDLIAQWHFDEPVGSTSITDAISGLVGILHGGVSIMSGSDCYQNNCAYFNGSGYIEVPRDERFNLPANKTLSVKLSFRSSYPVSTTSPNFLYLLGNLSIWANNPGNNIPGGKTGWYVGLTKDIYPSTSTSKYIVEGYSQDKDGKWIRSRSSANPFWNSNSSYTSNINVTDNNWHTVVFDQNNLSADPKFPILQLDSKFFHQGPNAQSLLNYTTTNSLYFGMAPPDTTSWYYTGYLDEVSIYLHKLAGVTDTPSVTPSPSKTATPTSTLTITSTPSLFPSKTPSKTPSATLTPAAEPLMCIDSRCTSSTGTMNYGSVISCEMSASGGLQRSYEGVCNVDRNGITLESITLTPISAGASQFLPFTLTHGNADLNCKFRVCEAATGQNTVCTSWGT